jgi:RNA polymerase sigma factor (TIGR02999 family)
MAMNDVTRILSAIEQGDPKAAEQLLPLVYDELRRLAAQRLAHERPGQTLQATALVHEAYVRLVDARKVSPWDSRGHFYALAGVAMRRVLVDDARRKQRIKRGGTLDRQGLEVGAAQVGGFPRNLDILALDKVLRCLANRDAVAPWKENQKNL